MSQYTEHSSANDKLAKEPGDLENEHFRLMGLQGKQADDRQVDELQIVEQARQFVAQVRQLGLHLEDGRARQHWQGIIDYWSIFAYRTAKIDFDSDLLAFDPSLAPALTDDLYPYAFSQISAQQSQQILGWRRLLDECERDLAGDQLLTIVGEVGSGRRFLLHDLMVPILREGRARRAELKGSEKWRYFSVRLGQQPIEDLLSAFKDGQQRDQAWVIAQAELLREHPERMASLLEPELGEPTFIAFESFESLLESSAEERDVVVRALASLLNDRQHRFYLAVTLSRSQALQLQRFGAIENALRDGHVLLAFTTAELRHLIEEPARRVGLLFDRGVVDRILIEIQGEPTAMPLLQFTLRRLWNARVQNRITRAAFEQLGAGTSALRIAMDAVYQDLNVAQQKVFQNLLLKMVKPDPMGHFAACDVQVSDLLRDSGDQQTLQELIEKLREQGLVYTYTTGDKQLLALSNSAVLTAWPELIKWLDELRLRQRFRLRLKESASEWQAHDNSNDLLWRSVMLVEAEREFTSDTSLTTPELDFLDKSRRRELNKERRRMLVFVIGLLLITALVVQVVAKQRAIASQQRAIASQQRAIASAERASAAEQKAIAAKQTAIAAALKQEQIASKQRAIAAEQTALAAESTNQQQRLANAVGALLSGDPAGMLLWLNERRTKASSMIPGDTDSINKEANSYESKMEQLAQLQLPLLKLRKAGSAADSTGPDKDRFNEMAVSPNGRFVATIRREKPNYLLEISRVESVDEAFELWKVPPREWGSNFPCKVSFFTLDDNDGGETYVIAGMGQSMQAWQVNGADLKQSQPVKLEPPEASKTMSVLSIDAKAGFLTVIWQNDSREQHHILELYQLSAGSEDHSIELKRLKSSERPEGLDELDGSVQIAKLSDQGHLVIVSGTDAEHATNLRVWRRSGSQWTAAQLPTWVQGLEQQRLRDWGWSAIDDENQGRYVWQRIDSYVRSVAFSPSGKDFATACNEGQVMVWGISQPPVQSAVFGPLVETELRLGSSAYDVTFLTESVLATAGRDRTARIWNIHTGVEMVPRNYHEGTVARVAFAEPDTLITRTEGILRTWQSRAYELIESPYLVRQAAVSEQAGAGTNGRQLFVTRAEPSSQLPQGSDKLADGAQPSPEVNQSHADKNRPEPKLPHAAIVFEDNGVLTSVSPDGAWIFNAAKSKDEQTYSISVRHKSEIDKPIALSIPDSLNSVPLVAFSPGTASQQLVVAERGNGSPAIYCWELRKPLEAGRTSGTETELPASFAPAQLTFNGLAMTAVNGKHVLAIIGKQQIDPATEKGIVLIGTRDLSDGSQWALSHLKIQENNAEDFPHREEVLCVAFSPSGEYLATGEVGDVVKIWRVSDLLKRQINESGDKPVIAKAIATFTHSSNVESLAFSPRGDVLATVSSEGEAAMWSMENLESYTDDLIPIPLYRLRHDARILSVSFSPSSEWIITGGLDCSARIWDRSTGALVGIFQHEQPVNKVWMLRDDQILTLSRYSDEESQLRFWEVKAEQEVSQSIAARIERLAARKVLKGSLETTPLNVGDFSSN